jgi:predicted nucleotidyltransferase
MTVARFGLPAEDISKLCRVFERYAQVKQVLIYGSRAKGHFHRGSDIDLTLIGDLDWPTFNQLERELDDLLLPYSIDISLYKQIENPELQAHIEHVGQVLFAR